MKRNILKSTIAASLFVGIFSMATQVYAGEKESCSPKASKSSNEVTTILSSTKVSGEEALNEMSSKKLTRHSDNIGRIMYSDVRTEVRRIDGSSKENSENGIYPMARVERYCSKSTDENAKCVDLCVRWTGFDDSRI